MGCTYAEVSQKKACTCFGNGFMTLNTLAENSEQCVLTFDSITMPEAKEISLFDTVLSRGVTRSSAAASNHSISGRHRFVMKGGFHKPGVGGRKRGLLVAGFIGR